MTCTEAVAAAVWGAHGSNRDRAVAKPQVSEVSKSLEVSEVMFEFTSLSSAPGRIRTCAHGSGGHCCMRLLPGKMCRSGPVGERVGSAKARILPDWWSHALGRVSAHGARIAVITVTEC